MYEKAKSSWIKHLDFTIIDILCLEVAYFMSFLFRDGWISKSQMAVDKISVSPFKNSFYQQIVIMLIIIDLIVVFTRRPYQDILRRGFFLEFKNVVVQNTAILLLVLLYLFVTQDAGFFSRAVYGITWVLGISFMYCARIGWKHFIRHRISTDENLTRILLITTKEQAQECIKKIKEHRYNGFHLVGIALLDEDMVGQELCEEMVVANKDTMFDYTLSNVVDAVLMSENLKEKERELYVYRFLSMGQTVHINLDKVAADLPNRMVQNVGNFTVMTTSIKAVDVRQLLVKRIMDIIGGIIGCAITLLVAIPLFPIVKIQAPGPLFFKQVRVGKNGRLFKMYKFRSMYIDAEQRKAELLKENEMQGQMFKIENDPRIFQAGHFIRRYSIDELPQFFNILKGDMSLVGTRPPTLDEYENYDPHHKIRLSIKPGLTGLWQVSGRNNIKDFDEVVRLDEKYIEDWNIGLDIKIILKTIKVVLGKDGAM